MKKSARFLWSSGAALRWLLIAVLLITAINEAHARQSVPAISSFSPISGAVGAVVSINGSNFDPVIANNIVYFGTVKATVISATPTSLNVTVPVGACSARIWVTVDGLTAISQKLYMVTFTSSRNIDSSTFSPRVDLPASSVTYNVAMGDLDGDGKPDLIAASYGTDRVFVFRNISTSGSLSAGSFAPEADFSTGDLSTGLILVDLDGDGKLDIVASHHNIGGPDDHHIAVLRNTSVPGTISFEPAILFEAGTGPFSVASDDFDHDGKLDLVVANFRSNTISFFRNTSTPGTISLDAKQDFSVGNYPRELAAADVDGDGRPDVVVACGGEVDVLHNTTATSVSFDAPFQLTGTGSLVPVVVGDFDGDGKLDLATANNANQVLVFPNTSLPGSLSFGAMKMFPSGENPWDIAIGDFDGDGKTDLAVANRSNFSGPGSVSILKNTSVGGVISFGSKVDFEARIGPGGLAVGDLDGDGKPDIAVSHEGDSYVSVLRNNISGEPVTILPPTVTSFTPLSGPVGTTVTITGSNFSPTAANNFVYIGGMKAAVINASTTSLIVTISSGSVSGPLTVIANGLSVTTNSWFNIKFQSSRIVDASTFQPAFYLNTGPSPLGAAVADFDGDGKQDLACTIQGDNTIAVFKNQGSTGSLSTASFAAPTILTCQPVPKYIAVADIDGDGKLDLVVTHELNYVSVFLNTSSGPGDISFGPRFDLAAGSGNQHQLVLADLDGDGKPDIVTNISLWRNTSTVGSLSFAPRADYWFSSTSVAVCDIDGDGRPDVVGSNYSDSTVSIFRNTSQLGTISLASRLWIADVGEHPWTVNIADYDGDGLMDIAVAYQGEGHGGVTILRNRTATIGNPQFESPVKFLSGGGGGALCTSDVDGDGRPDLVLAGVGIVVLQNRTAGGPFNASSFKLYSAFAGGGFSDLFVGDLDGDGRPDIIAPDYWSQYPNAGNTISILRNTIAPAAPVEQLPITVTFLANTSTVPDTLKASSFVQVRGSLPSLGPWDQSSPALLTNIGGDYWKGSFGFHKGDTIQYKYFTNPRNPLPAGQENLGWEMDLYQIPPSSINRFLIVGSSDTTLPLEFVNGSPTSQLQYWRPYTDVPDSIEVLFRANMQGKVSFNRATQFVGIRGGTPPLDWTKSIVLSRESHDGNTNYDGTNFWSGVVRFPASAFSSDIQYKFVVLGANDPVTPVLQWETDIPNRVLSSNSTPHDTTLAWKWWDDAPPVPAPIPGPAKIVTIPQLQQVSQDSLLKLDIVQDGAGGKSLQQSPFWHGSNVTGADTVTVTGVVIVKPRILTYTLARYNLYIQDTTGQVWGGLNVLTNDTSVQAQSTGIAALDTGMVVTISGRVTEFGTQNNSLTEIFHYSTSAPVYTGAPPITIGAMIARPAPKEITLDTLAAGNFPRPSRAEKYESMYVVVRNVTVNSVDVSSGRFSFQDSLGNVGYMFDGSGWYTLRGHKFNSSSYTPPPLGTRLNYIRGVIVSQVPIRPGTCGDYAVMPLYPGDIGIGSTPAPLAPTLSFPANGAIGQPSSLGLQWNPVTGATSYGVQISTSPTFVSLLYDSGPISQPGFTFPALPYGTTFYWRVSASSAGVSSSWSTTWSFTTVTVILPPPSTSWSFVKNFTNLAGGAGVHGLAVDPQGRVWIAPYGATDSVLTPSGYRMSRALYVYNPNGQPAPFSPIKLVTVNGVTDTLFAASRGLSTDPNGNILYTTDVALYRINYQTGQGMARVVPQGNVSYPYLTAPATDQSGNVFVGKVWPGNPVQVFGTNFNLLGTITTASTGFSRTIAASADGKNVFWPEYDRMRLIRFNSPNGPSGAYSKADSIFPGLAIESMTWHPKTGYLWVSSGSDYNPPAAPYPILTWYGLDLAHGNIADTIAWNQTPGTLSGRPRAIAFSPTGDTAYVGCFLLDANYIQMFVKHGFGSPQQAHNGSALFDGSGSRMRVADGGTANPNAFRINGAAISVEAWVYPMSYPSPQYGNTIVTRALNTLYTDPWISYRLWVNHSNGVSLPAFSISAGTPGSTVTVQSPDDLPSFQWTHLAATYDGTVLNIYVNGTLKAHVNTTISINSANGVGFYVGRYLTDAFMGAIDEVRLWNIARSQSDIQISMQTPLTGNEPGLAGYWNMNPSTLATNPLRMLDQTVNHNDLPVQGTTPIINFNPVTSPGTPVFSSTPSSLVFGPAEQGSVSTSSLTIKNNGTTPMLGFLEASSSDAQVATGGMFFADSGQTVTTALGLRPMISGVVSGNIVARANGGVHTQIPYSVVSVALKQFDGNNISMWTLRDGRFAYNPLTQNAGLEWPKGSGKTAVYESGLWIGATVGGSLKTATAWYWSEFTPGPIINGVAANPNDTTYRVYKLRKGDSASTNADYASWPASLGAPVNLDGSPQVIGEQTLFSVYNDFNTNPRHFGTGPLGAEVQQTIFGFGQSGARANSVFLRFKVINKSSATWNNTYIGLWSDPDLGDATDDLVGVDTTRSLGFVYNGSNTDAVYGSPPPAAGYQVLKGAFFTKPIQSFAYFATGSTSSLVDPNTAAQGYNAMQGRWPDGTSFIDQNGLPTTFAVSGDPVTGSGMIDTRPSDRRMLLSTGPFDLEPGQSKEFVAAIIMGQGTSNLNSITALRSASDEIQTLYNNGQLFGGALVDIASASALGGSSNTINDIARSGAQISFTGGTGGATVESASYLQAPAGVTSLSTTAVTGVGKYLDVQVQGEVTWPVQIRIYYTMNDLLQAGVVESDIQGVYYWSGSTNTWNLYSSSGSDDQGRGPSTTGVDTTNVTINGVTYEGYVLASAFHLTPMIAGAKKKSIVQRYDDAIQYVQSLPDAAFKKPAAQRRSDLMDKLGTSKTMFLSGNIKAAVQKLLQDILNHLTAQGNSSQDLWVQDDASRARLLRMVNDLADVLQRPQTMAKTAAAGALLAAPVVEVPTEYGLSQNYPNPFNPSTTIQYQIPQAGQVSLKVYNTLGAQVATLVSGFQNPGFYRVQWNPQLPSGVYLYRLQSGTFVQSRKLILLK